ncbi:protein tyrosine kinase activity protein [Globodera pallida]|nr:protein tyrosine kinase activity protein [Globodera pallida]
MIPVGVLNSLNSCSTGAAGCGVLPPVHRLFVDQKWVTFALDLNRGIDSNLEQTTGCLRQKTITSIVGEFVWNKVASPQLYALTWNGLIEMKLNSDNNCPSTSTGPCLEDFFGKASIQYIFILLISVAMVELISNNSR